MKILVTGGSGFIGSHIVDQYVALGHDVAVVDDLSTGSEANHNAKVKYYRLDVGSLKLAEVLAAERPQVVNHLAAQIDLRKSLEDPLKDAEINILGTLNLLSQAQKAGVKKFIFSSSAAVYGQQHVFPADETHRVEPQTPYGIGKLAAEFYLKHFQRLYQIPCVIFRYANVYGPRQNSLGEAGVISIFATKLLQGEAPVIFGDGKQTRDFVFVEDVVACHAKALDADVSGIYHVATGIETDLNRLMRTMIDIVGSKVKPRYAPPKLGDPLRSSLKAGALQLQQPVALAEGLKKTIAWFRR